MSKPPEDGVVGSGVAGRWEIEGDGGVKRDEIGDALPETSADLGRKSTEGSTGVEVDAGERGVDDVVGASDFEAEGRTEGDGVEEVGV